MAAAARPQAVCTISVLEHDHTVVACVVLWWLDQHQPKVEQPAGL